MKIPDSISAMVFQMKHTWLWTVAVELLTLVTLILMTEHSATYAGVAFAACACIGFVGVMPLVRHDENKAHYVLAIAGAVISQIWCLLIGANILLWWTVYLLLLPLSGRKWCLIAECWAVAAVWLVAIGT